MKALIIEDYEPVALGIQKTFTDRGHQCDCILGVRSFEPFIGIGLDKQDVAINPSDYDVVLCDGELAGNSHGNVVVQNLSARGIACVAISSQDDFNAKMVAAGARIGFSKLQAFAAIIEGDLTIEDCPAPSPAVVGAVLAYKERLNLDISLRRKLEAILMS